MKNSITESYYSRSELMAALSAVSKSKVNEMLNPLAWLNEQILSFSNSLAQVKTRNGLRKALEEGARSLVCLDQDGEFSLQYKRGLLPGRLHPQL